MRRCNVTAVRQSGDGGFSCVALTEEIVNQLRVRRMVIVERTRRSVPVGVVHTTVLGCVGGAFLAFQHRGADITRLAADVADARSRLVDKRAVCTCPLGHGWCGGACVCGVCVVGAGIVRGHKWGVEVGKEERETGGYCECVGGSWRFNFVQRFPPLHAPPSHPLHPT